MKRVISLFCLMLMLPLLASGEAMPDASGCYKEKDITPMTMEGCGMTYHLQDGVNTITRPGTYLVRGSCNGQLVVDVKDADVYLLLDGVRITSPDGPAIYVKAADKVVMTLADGTESTLTDSAVYTLPNGEDEPNGALFSKEDLSINGTGTLRVIAQYDDGVVSKDSLVIADANIIVTSKGDGIRGKDSVTLLSCDGFR